MNATTESHEEIRLTWSKPANAGGSPITGYFIEVSSDDGSSWTTVRKNTGSTGTVFKHEGLTRATVYTYRVAAINKVGTGEKSEVAVARTLAVVPTPPRYLEAEAQTSTRIDLIWTEPEDDGGESIESYLVEASLDLDEWTRLADVERGVEYSHSEVQPGQTTHYRVSAKNGAGYSPTSNIATATTDDPIERTERVITAILPRFGITAVNSSLRAIVTRIDLIASDRAMTTRINVAGGRDGLTGIANGSQIVQPISGASIWGSADMTGLNETGTVNWDGEVFSVHAGLDGMLRDGILVGLAGSRSKGAFGFTDRMGTQGVEGEFDASLTSMNPYIAWIRDDVGVWAATGFGWGTIEVSDAVADRSSTLVSSMLAAGGFREIMSSPIGSFHLRVEGMSSQIDVSGNIPTHIRDAVEPDHINESTVRMRRGRVMLDWRTPRKEYGEYNAEIRFEGGMRYDYNDLDTGISGAEVGGGIRLDGPLFRVYGNARMFTHLDHQEWGVQGLVELRSRQENGLSLQIHPTYGDAASGLNQLWENGVPENLTSGSMNGRVSTVLEYRHPKLAPYTRFNYRDHRTDIQAGLMFRLKTLEWKVEVTHQNDTPGLSIRLRS